MAPQGGDKKREKKEAAQDKLRDKQALALEQFDQDCREFLRMQAAGRDDGCALDAQGAPRDGPSSSRDVLQHGTASPPAKAKSPNKRQPPDKPAPGTQNAAGIGQVGEQSAPPGPTNPRSPAGPRAGASGKAKKTTEAGGSSGHAAEPEDQELLRIAQQESHTLKEQLAAREEAVRKMQEQLNMLLKQVAMDEGKRAREKHKHLEEQSGSSDNDNDKTLAERSRERRGGAADKQGKKKKHKHQDSLSDSSDNDDDKTLAERSRERRGEAAEKPGKKKEAQRRGSAMGRKKHVRGGKTRDNSTSEQDSSGGTGSEDTSEGSDSGSGSDTSLPHDHRSRKRGRKDRDSKRDKGRSRQPKAKKHKDKKSDWTNMMKKITQRDSKVMSLWYSLCMAEHGTLCIWRDSRRDSSSDALMKVAIQQIKGSVKAEQIEMDDIETIRKGFNWDQVVRNSTMAVKTLLEIRLLSHDANVAVQNFSKGYEDAVPDHLRIPDFGLLLKPVEYTGADGDKSSRSIRFGGSAQDFAMQFGSATTETASKWQDIVTVLQKYPGGYRRLGVVGDNMSYMRLADGVPMDDTRRPEFGPFFWLFGWPALWNMTHIKHHWSRGLGKEPGVNEPVVFRDLCSKWVAGDEDEEGREHPDVMAAFQDKSKQDRYYKFSKDAKKEFKDKLLNPHKRFILKDLEEEP